MSDQYQTAGEIAGYLDDLLKTITKANGYETDIGLRVFRGRRAVHDDHVPCAALIEGNDRVTQGDSKKAPTAKITQDYVLTGYSPCDADNPNDEAHAIIRDLKKAVFGGQNGATLGGKVSKVEYRGRDIGPRADGKAIVMALIEVSIDYVEKLDQP